MSQSTDPERFFQTDDSIAELNRKALKSKNTNGSPIRVPSKILAVISDPTDSNRVYVAEAAGPARRIALEKNSISHIYRGPTAPLTCLALSPTSRSSTLFGGSWDKTIWSWDTTTRAPQQRYRGGHSDFVKAVTSMHLHGKDYLISGGADASIVIWDILGGTKLHTLRGGSQHCSMGGVQDLVLDPATTYPTEFADSGLVFFSAGSDRTIRRWEVVASADGAGERSAPLLSFRELKPEKPIVAHETSVYKLVFDRDEDLWSASADGTVKCLNRERGWEVDTVFMHGDFVRSIGLGGVADQWVVSGGREEEVRVWDKGTGTLYHTFSGHYDEITDLVVLSAQKVVSVSIDGTIRQWSLKPDDLQKAKLEAAEAAEGVVKEAAEKKVPLEKSLMSEDEERELAELMNDSD